MVPEYTADAIEPYSIYEGDCVAVMKTWPDECIDAIVCDPPYDLLQASRKGSGRSNEPDNPYGRHGSRGRGFMGMAWDATGVAFDPATWKEALRVLKPGGHLLAMGGTRTFHRLACAIEDAGFEIRDSIGVLGWCYGSGFPKSLNVSVAVDKAAGAKREVVNVIDPRSVFDGHARSSAATNTNWRAAEGRCDVRDLSKKEVTVPATDAAKTWHGFGTALKPAFEPIICARKPIKGTVAANILQYGTGGLNIDVCRVATTDNLNGGAYSGGERPTSAMGLTGQAGGTSSMLEAGGGRLEPEDYKQPVGRFPPNLVLVHHPDCNEECVEGCPVLEMGKQSGETASTSKTTARFFPCFKYQAKAGKRERNLGLPEDARNIHATVKPLKLMQWMVRLVTPPGGLVLDPFLGSGTTAMACELEHFRWVGIERETEYIAIAEQRIRWAAREAGRIACTEEATED